MNSQNYCDWKGQLSESTQGYQIQFAHIPTGHISTGIPVLPQIPIQNPVQALIPHQAQISAQESVENDPIKNAENTPAQAPPNSDQSGASLVSLRESERNWRSATDGYLETMRDQLALFQEGRGVPRGEYSFVTLMAAIVTMVSQSIHSVISLMLTLAPITEVGLHVLRFSLETIIELRKTRSVPLLVKKVLIFTFQLGLALSFVMFVFGSILYPVFSMGVKVGLRTMGIITGRGLLF